jgi:hypothetical protein
MGEWLLSRRDSTIVARHEVPGIMRKIAFVPGYYQPVPPGQKPFAHRSASSSPTTGLSGRAGTREVDVNRMTRITASMLKIASSHDHGLLEQAASCDV